MSEQNKTEQKPSGALERLELLEKKFEQIEVKYNKDGQAFEMLAKKELELEQGLTSIAKTLAGLVSALSDKKVVADEEIISRIRRMDEEEERKRLGFLKSSNIIRKSESVQTDSLVVISQALMTTDGSIKNISDFRIIEMPLYNNKANDKVFLALIGKKVKESFQLPGNNSNETVLVTVQEIYELVPQGGQPAPESTGSEPQPAPAPAN
jgi:hypothetical protein